jgi:hypothetical protein
LICWKSSERGVHNANAQEAAVVKVDANFIVPKLFREVSLNLLKILQCSRHLVNAATGNEERQ